MIDKSHVYNFCLCYGMCDVTDADKITTSLIYVYFPCFVQKTRPWLRFWVHPLASHMFPARRRRSRAAARFLPHASHHFPCREDESSNDAPHSLQASLLFSACVLQNIVAPNDFNFLTHAGCSHTRAGKWSVQAAYGFFFTGSMPFFTL